MSSDRPLPSLRRRIVAVSLAAGAVLFLLAGGVTLAVAYRVLRAEETAMLAELADGLAEAVAAAGGDMAALQRDFDETLELFGPDDTALLLAGLLAVWLAERLICGPSAETPPRKKRGFDWGMHYMRGFAIVCIMLTHFFGRTGAAPFTHAESKTESLQS